jgi:hypothetical protein
MLDDVGEEGPNGHPSLDDLVVAFTDDFSDARQGHQREAELEEGRDAIDERRAISIETRLHRGRHQ